MGITPREPVSSAALPTWMNAPSGTHVTFPATLADVAPQLIWYPACEVSEPTHQGIIRRDEQLIKYYTYAGGNERIIMAEVMRGSPDRASATPTTSRTRAPARRRGKGIISAVAPVRSILQ